VERKEIPIPHFAVSQVCFDWEAWDRFSKLFGGELPIPTLAAVSPLRSLKMAPRLHKEVLEDLLTELDTATSYS